MQISEFERIDDLQIKGYKVVQDIRGFCFGVDAVILEHFTKVKKDAVVVDFGCGCGIIPVLLCAKREYVKKIYGIEIQEYIAKVAQKSVEINNLQDRVQILNIDLMDSEKVIKSASVDNVIVNPPYNGVGAGIENENKMLRIARHEINCTIFDISKAAAKLLKFSGRLSMILRPERICEAVCAMKEAGIEPKRMCMVYPKPSKAPSMFLIEGQKGRKAGVLFEEPVIIHNEDGSYTKKIDEIYGRDAL